MIRFICLLIPTPMQRYKNKKTLGAMTMCYNMFFFALFQHLNISPDCFARLSKMCSKTNDGWRIVQCLIEIWHMGEHSLSQSMMIIAKHIIQSWNIAHHQDIKILHTGDHSISQCMDYCSLSGNISFAYKRSLKLYIKDYI